MKIAITGCSGYVAGQLIPMLREHTIYKMDRNDSGGFDDPPERVDALIHLAALTNLYECEKNPGASILSNVILPSNVIRYCLENKCRLIFPSSSTADDSLGESRSLYDKHKRISEILIKSTPNLDAIILRFGTIYGYSNSQSGPGRGIVNRWIKSAIDGDKMTIYDLVVNKRRDYVHLDDVVNAIIASLDVENGTYGVWTGECRSIYEAVRIIESEVGGKAEITPTPEGLHAIDLRDEVLGDPSSIMGVIPKISFIDGVIDTATKYKVAR